jgi:hypothetical protein
MRLRSPASRDRASLPFRSFDLPGNAVLPGLVRASRAAFGSIDNLADDAGIDTSGLPAAMADTDIKDTVRLRVPMPRTRLRRRIYLDRVPHFIILSYPRHYPFGRIAILVGNRDAIAVETRVSTD